jgi:hypothetical protein
MNSESEFDKKIEAEESNLRRKNRAIRLRNLLLLVLFVLTLLFAMVTYSLAMDNRRLAEVNAQYGAAQKQEKQSLAEDFTAACKSEDFPKTTVGANICRKAEEVAAGPADPPPAPPMEARGPTPDEIKDAVESYCLRNRCQGEDGKTPTPADVAAAVVAKCADGSCRGPEGEKGDPGQNAPPVTTAEIVTAIATYCSTGVCAGPPGPTGANGADGANATGAQVQAAVDAYCATGACVGPKGVPGRGISSTVCNDDGRWIITYTDGGVQDAGQCRSPIIGVRP